MPFKSHYFPNLWITNQCNINQTYVNDYKVSKYVYNEYVPYIFLFVLFSLPINHLLRQTNKNLKNYKSSINKYKMFAL